ncbi:MAG: hypothetical protein IJJ33_12805, partial [Victivallales bacterium]|nr:hypothetical protein [Victivallales bacterium]
GALLLVDVGKRSGGNPIAGRYDCRRRKEIFGRVPPAWRANARLGNQPLKMDSVGQNFALSLLSEKAPWRGAITWDTPNGVNARSEFTFADSRLEMDLSVKSANPQLCLDEVVFPYSRLRRLAQGVDRLIVPRMSGVVYEHPIDKEVPQPWKNYPNGELNMQFHAYYDDGGGVYFAQEDPYGGSKRFQTRGRGGELEFYWSHPVAFSPEEKGGREFALSGLAVWELFQGDWFEAGQIYRRFLSAKAKWWIPELPQTSTPQWMRDNTLWLLHLVFTEQTPYAMIANLRELRDYLELPFGLHFYEWFDLKRGSFPHFYAKQDAIEVLNELNDIGVRVKPYIDNRSWSTMDGEGAGDNGRRYDFQFTDLASRYATRNREGEFTLEGGRYRCAVMCPAVPEWQDYIFRLVRRLAGQGFHAIYHDEVTTAQPIPCFNPEHGHRLNDPRNWLEHGYWPMLERLRTLRPRYPELVHDSEDASEPYMHALDGVCPYRWTNTGQVPLFVSIYSGRTQFDGRIYDHHTPGVPESFFDKLAVQLVGSEQLGWFTSHYLDSPERRLYTKRLMHLRTALLAYFNEGRMVKPLSFVRPPASRTLLWGGLTPEKVTNPKVHHSVFEIKDGQIRVVIWVNSSPDTETVAPVLKPEWGRLACLDGTVSAPLFPGTTPELTLGPRSQALWLLSANEGLLRQEAARLHGDLRRIAAFAPGKLRWERFNQPQPLNEQGELLYDFEDAPVWRAQPAWRGLGCYELIGSPRRGAEQSFQWALEPDAEYELSLAMRLDAGLKAEIQVRNFNRENQPAVYADVTAELPDDGCWHLVKATFRTDGSLHRCGIHFKLAPSVHGSLFIDEIRLRRRQAAP